MSFNKKKKKKKIVPTNILIDSVLNPRSFIGSKKEMKAQKFYQFIIKATDDEFDRAIDNILNDQEVYNTLSQCSSTVSDILTKKFISHKLFTTYRSLRLYRAILSKKIDDLSYFQFKKVEAEGLFVRGLYEKTLSLIEEIDAKNGPSFWSINMRFAIYAASKKYSKIDEYLEWLKNENKDSKFQEIVRVIAWKSQSFDSDLIVESMVRRANKEFIEGGALDIAAFYSLLLLPYPLFDDVNLGYSLKWLQQLTLIDTYESLIKIASCILQDDNIEEAIKLEFKNIFNLFKSANHPRLENIITSLNGKDFIELNPIVDMEIDEYTKGNYESVIKSLEKNFKNDNNLITKINIYAKSYVHLGTSPNNLPSFLNDVIQNLIKIYSLVDSSQSVSMIKNLAIKYSSLEISEHLVISIDKSAPFFFDEDSKKKIRRTSAYLSLPLTPLSCNLESRPALYLSEINGNIAEHLILKKKAIASLLSDDPKSLDYIEDYYNKTKIIKDAIELKVEYFLRKNDIDGLIVYSSEELIENPNSSLCLPLNTIIDYIDRNCIYTLDSVICAYYYNHFSDDDESSILNEVFEELIISLGVQRPSELIRKDLSKKELFLLNDISKIDVMDYLGCFEDNNDLKIERINILNKLVENKYLSQLDIDRECKQIVDDILIDSEAAKFNNSKIFVDTKFIFEKRKDDIISILNQFTSQPNTLEPDVESLSKIESMTVPKGNKNDLVTRLISLLLVEFMNNKEVGLDKNLSSEIRHGFFSNLMCSKLQNRNLITELNEKGSYSSNKYWLDYYSMVNNSIINSIDELMIKFSSDFNKLVDIAEEWMKTSLNGDEIDRLFVFNFNIDEFEIIRRFIETNKDPSDVSDLIFGIFNSKLTDCMDALKAKLNEDFAVRVDELFSNLIDEINERKHGTSLSDLFREIRLANTEVKEDIRTVCEWFSFKKNVEFESFEIVKSILLAERCFKQINNSDMKVNINKNSEITIEGHHLYALVFTFINCFNNSYKYSDNNSDIDIDITINQSGEDSFSIKAKNKISYEAKKRLESGILDKVRTNLANMENDELLTKEGGSGLYKSLHGLRMASERYNLLPSFSNDTFCVELTYE